MKVYKIIILFILLIALTGCFNYKEINDYALVSGISIDINNNEYEVGLQIMSADEDNNTSVTLYKGNGNSIWQAIEKINIPKKLYLGHNEVIIISEELLKKKNPLDYLDFFLRESHIEKDSLVINAKDNKAYDTLKVVSPLKTISSSNIKSILNIDNNKVFGITIDELIYTLKTNSKEVVVPTVIIEDEKIKYTNLGYFKNNKLYGYLNEDETKGYNLLLGKESYINVKCNQTSYATLKIENTKVKDSISFTNKKPIVNKKISIRGKIIEDDCEDNFIKNNNSIKKLELLTTENVSILIDKAIKRLYYDSKSDVLGYGNKYYAKDYKKMNNLGYTKKDIIESISFNTNVKVKIDSTSLSLKSIKGE